MTEQDWAKIEELVRRYSVWAQSYYASFQTLDYCQQPDCNVSRCQDVRAMEEWMRSARMKP